MPQLVCNTCQANFADYDLHRAHYQSAWHQYNLKRKIANSLAPVTAKEFEERALAKHQESIKPQNTSKRCDTCKKSFSSENAFRNHTNSKKHVDMVIKMSEGLKTNVSNTNEKEEELECEEVDSDEWEDMPLTVQHCLFCCDEASSMERNVAHMIRKHSFFIPDAEYVVDLEGLLTYLAEKVGEGFVCLWCCHRGRRFYSLESVQGHMRDKGHCKMLFEGSTLDEYAEFYDYSSSYPEEGNPNDEVEIPVLEEGNYQLTLPSGAVVGHRSLVAYYRQRLPAEQPKRMNRVVCSYRAIGRGTCDRRAVVKTAKNVMHMRIRQQKREMKLGVAANKLQTHFRQQI